ncbi:MAG: TetR/AcrR family transcriptional regulator [Proteobacteria bacterium]|nr:TetR/AcrR family transcriptional regulator [Pseudomonadota bacterium]
MRRLVLSAAEDILQEDGLHALSIRDLAARTGYSPSALYKHFDSKEDVVGALKEAFLQRLLESMRLAVAEHEKASDRLHAELKAYVLQGLAQPNHFIEVFSNPAGMVASTEAGPEAMEILYETIRRGIEAGEFADRDIKAAALSVWASVHGLTLIMASTPSTKWGEPEQVIDDHVRFTIAALGRA